MGSFPFIQFFTGDWLKDPALTSCAPATRGVWIDLLCAMHEAGRSGELRGTHEQLARFARCSTADIALALTDLQATGAADVSSRNDIVTVTCRRMSRESNARGNAANRQARHRVRKKSRGRNAPRDGHIHNQSPEPEPSATAGAVALTPLPPLLDVDLFRQTLADWLAYKRERRESYKPVGLKSMLAMAETRAKAHGVEAVVGAMQTAMANCWQGWDQPRSFGAKTNERIPDRGTRYVPGARLGSV